VAGVEWYKRAAEQGDAKAQGNLGVAYLNGLGVPQDFVTALMWSNLAAAQGRESAKKNKEILEKRMTAKQIAEAQRRSSEWKPSR
jgi:TPR repeat protein